MPEDCKIPASVLFISFVGRNYSRSGTILNSQSIFFRKKYFGTSPGIWNAMRDLVKNRNSLRDCSVVVVMSPCHILVPIAKLIIKKPVILDAGWALIDGEFSRGLNGKRLIRFPLVYLIDFLAFICSDFILVETSRQVSRIHKLFHIKRSKMRVSLTGLNEFNFLSSSRPSSVIETLSTNDLFNHARLKILFRGKINQESGVETIIKAAQESDRDKFYIFAIGSQDTLDNIPLNATVLRDLSMGDLKHLYEIVDVCIGQFSVHPRLNFTIPHKAFEAAFFGKPYITADSKGIHEFLSPDDALFVQEPSSSKLLDAINILNDSSKREKLGFNIRETYLRKSSQFKINKDFEEIVLNTINNHVDKVE